MPKMKIYKKHTQNGIHSMDWEHYHDLATMYDYLDYLMSKQYWKMLQQISNALHEFLTGNPDYNITTETIGQSYEGRNLRIAKICRDGCGNKPAMYIQGGIHVCFVSHMSNEQFM